MAALRETGHLYEHLLYQAVLGFQSPLRNFDDPGNARRIFLQLLNRLVTNAGSELPEIALYPYVCAVIQVQQYTESLFDVVMKPWKLSVLVSIKWLFSQILFSETCL